MSLRVALAAGVLALAAGAAQGQQPAPPPAGFEHARHQRLFPACEACHRGAVDPEQGMWPAPAACETCHDGSRRSRVAWQPPREGTPHNLKFSHEMVPMMTRPSPTGPQELACGDCHATPGQVRMATVHRATPEGCLACHGPGIPHLAADRLCETCHVPLPRATRLRLADVASFPAPPSHREPGFAGGGHGALASSTCAVCHAREFCMTCHVDAPERPAIQALASDPRSRAIAVRLEAPPSHRRPTFLREHGAAVAANPRQCVTCHTRESCATCHAPSQRVATALPARAPERGIGAQPLRRPPPSHRENFAERHKQVAAATPASCAGCHVRTDCTECHRPAAAAGPGYHPAGFLARHPVAAYARETSCVDCHNAAGFCQVCHAAAGLASTKPLGSGYHDAARFFISGHGQAARQSLETCVSCHVERDCLSCHSAAGGRRFNPHGPGFDAARLRRKNPEMCTACHGTLIPGG